MSVRVSSPGGLGQVLGRIGMLVALVAVCSQMILASVVNRSSSKWINTSYSFRFTLTKPTSPCLDHDREQAICYHPNALCRSGTFATRPKTTTKVVENEHTHGQSWINVPSPGEDRCPGRQQQQPTSLPGPSRSVAPDCLPSTRRRPLRDLTSSPIASTYHETFCHHPPLEFSPLRARWEYVSRSLVYLYLPW